MMITHHANPIRDLLLERLATAQHEVTLVAPYISNAILRECLTATPSSAKVSVLTALRLDSYLSGSLEIQELRNAILSTSRAAYSLARLHAKAIVVDDTFCYIGSNNLTFGGWDRNAELGVSLYQTQDVQAVKQTLGSWVNSETSFRIEPQMLDELLLVPRPSSTATRLEQVETTVPVAQDVLMTVSGHLSGWRATTFELVHSKMQHEFSLSDIYQFVPDLKKMYPNNNYIEDKLRQQLQDLRKLGFVAFLGGGRYQKLF